MAYHASLFTALGGKWRDCSRLILSLRTQTKRIDSGLPVVVSWAHNENRIATVVDICDGNPTVWGGVHLRNTFLSNETQSPGFTTHAHFHAFVLHIEESLDRRLLATRIDLPFLDRLAGECGCT